jgi:uncharacterized protein involved in outer membrane biogenesis
MSKFKRYIKTLAYLCVAIFALMLAVGVFTRTDFFKENAKEVICREIQGRIEAKLELGTVEGNFLTNIILKGVRLKGPEGQILCADGIRIDYFIPALVRRICYIRRLSLQGPTLTLVRDEAGIWNYQGLTPKMVERETDAKDAPGSWSVVVKNIKVEDGFLSIIDHKESKEQPAIQDIKSINLSAYLDLSAENGGDRATFVFENASFEVASPALRISKASGRISFDGEDVVIDCLELHTENPEDPNHLL